MKFTRKFLDGYITYDESDSIVNANSFVGFIFKGICALIWGTFIGLIMFAIVAALAYFGFNAIVWVLSAILG